MVELDSLDSSRKITTIYKKNFGMGLIFRDESNEPSSIMIGYSDAIVTASNHPLIMWSKTLLARVTATVP